MNQQDYTVEKAQPNEPSIICEQKPQELKQPNALLKRLIEEVNYEALNNISSYNRTHNRHNRGR